MKNIKIEAARENEIRAADQKHRLVFGGSNMDTVIHLTDDELNVLEWQLTTYRSQREGIRRLSGGRS